LGFNWERIGNGSGLPEGRPRKGDDMWYTVNYACGHTKDIQLTGPTRERERKIRWLETCDCEECQEKARKAAIEKETGERGLPELEGTEKQVAWAASIRLSQIEPLEEWADRLRDRAGSLTERLEKAEAPEEIDKLVGRISKFKDKLAMVVSAIEGASAITDASWWIDHRKDGTEEFADAVVKLQGDMKAEAIAEEASPKKTMEPEEKRTGTVATLTVDNGCVLLKSEKDELIRATVKANGFSWDSGQRAWAKAITEMTGEARHLLPDTARILLEAGIPVKAEQWVKDHVEDGSYEPECHRWVTKSLKYEGKLIIRKADGVKLPGGCKTTWEGNGIIDPARWREVREFASLNGYKVTRAAEAMLKAAEEATVEVRPKARQAEAGNAEETLKGILESSRGVLEDLKDED